jgi:RDD family
MNCPSCGSSSDEACLCESDTAVASPRWIPDAESNGVLATPPVSDEGSGILEANSVGQSLTPVELDPAGPVPAAEADSSVWRNELSARLDRYRARRKPRPPRYPSLRLRFEGPLHNGNSDAPPVPVYETQSNQALALDGLSEIASSPVDVEKDPEVHHFLREFSSDPTDSAQSGTTHSESHAPHSGATYPSVSHTGASHPGAKILEFPRIAGAAPPTYHDQLAEPVMDRPRILDVPEVAPLSPALGGITIETLERKEAEKRPGIDFPLESAPLARRIAAAATDGLIIASASALFAFVFWKVTGYRPPLLQICALAAGILCVLWAAYQYLLLVYSASTPGLRLAQIELTHFDGRRTSRRIRRWRVLASYLSAVSLGMGYAWVLLDEDALCWHDRITRTYLAPKKRENAGNVPEGA